MWPPFKPTSVRKREAEQPPALRDTLDDAAAERLSTTMISGLQSFHEPRFSGFLRYLLFHHGTADTLPIKDRAVGNEAIFRQHVRWAGTKPDSLSDLLDFFAQFQVNELQREYQRGWGYGLNPDLFKRQVHENIAHANASLQHDAVMYRIEPDAQFGFAVHKIGSEALQRYAIEPALFLMRDAAVVEPLKEYEQALVSWAKGDRRNAILQSSHALETLIKAILQERKVTYKHDAVPSLLIKHLKDDAKVLPVKYGNFWEAFASLIQGVVTVRSAAPGAGHGPAPGDPEPDEETTEYAVNMAGANIVFLMQRWMAVKNP